MSAECRACASDRAHCHGTVIIHAVSRAECTEPNCETPEFVHDYRIDCSAVGCACDALLDQGPLDARRVI